IAAPAWVFVRRERLPIEACTKVEARASRLREHHVGVQEMYCEVDGSLEPGIEMDRGAHRMIRARDVERQEQRSAWTKHPRELAERHGALVRLEVDQRVSRDRPAPRRVSRVDGEHRADAKVEPRKTRARDVYHGRGKIQTEDLRTAAF